MASDCNMRRTFITSIAAAGAALLGGCSPLRVLNGLIPSEHYRRVRDLAYGEGPRRSLDIYRPEPAITNAPVVVFFYGGNWNSGKKEDYLFVGEALASRGFVTVVPDYRLYPEVRYPDFLDDSAQAVRYAIEHARDHGGDPGRLLLMGHSAGAYNAAMLALEPEYLRKAGVKAGTVCGLIGLAGPYDFLPLDNDNTRGIFGYPDTPLSTQPIQHVTKEAPPTLLLKATEDDVVNPGNSTRLAARLRDNKVPVKEISYPSLGHRTIIGAMATPLRRLAPVLDDVTAFMNSNSG